jgi:hypothetical protein
MVALIRTMAFEGVDVWPVDAHVQVSGGRPAHAKVGTIALGNSQTCSLIFGHPGQET